MKPLSILLSLCGLFPCLRAEETKVELPLAEEQVSIPSPISDGTPQEPAPPPEIPDFKILESRARRLDVVEAPPMAGLPPVTGTVSLTVHKVEDPLLPELPAPLPPLDVTDPVVIARLAEFRKKLPDRRWVFLSATVYDNRRTFLRIYSNGKPDQSVTAWSTVDFNCFGGFGSYQVTGTDGKVREVNLLMSIGNMNTARMREWALRMGRDYLAPEIPELPDTADGEPVYLALSGEAGSEAMATLGELHALYRKEGPRMEEAFRARGIAWEEQKAFFLANPPKPKSLVLHYWRGKRPEDKGGDR